MKLYLLGTHATLSIAELNSMGINGDTMHYSRASLFKTESSIDIEKLGGAQKRYEVLLEGPATRQQIVDLVCEQLLRSTSSRTSYAFDCPDSHTSFNELHAIHKTVQSKLGKKVRLINRNGMSINSATSVHNKTYRQKNAFEFHLSKLGIAMLDDVQNLKRYTDRDQKRPKRDARVGMLPPKLAQIMVNISSGTKPGTVLDPFCGTGVVLQEAMIAGHNAIGSDINPLMIEYSSENIEWLKKKYRLQQEVQLNIGDATSTSWDGFTAVASETYLGTPLSSRLDKDSAQNAASELEPLQTHFISNLSKNMSTGVVACLAFPSWITKTGDFINSQIIDKKVFDAYNLEQIEFAGQNMYHYSRPQQSVARCIIILKKV